MAVAWGQDESLPASGVIPNRYIVVLNQGADHARVAGRHGLAPDQVYTHALKGFAAFVPPGQFRQLQRDSDIATIEPDQVVTIIASANGKAAKPLPAQVLPPGITRIGAAASTIQNFSAIGIAIIDTGIDLTHPDLNVRGNVTFVSGTRSGNDDHGHGTHCAGIAAAINNSIGVAGVAPNARLYAVKVLSRSGSGTISGVIAGVDWVRAHAGSLGIRVANMSLGGGNSPTLNAAIADSVANGVAYCVAAGNDHVDASSSSPANCPSALAVSAIVDTDGLCGHAGGTTGYGADDTFATFSNYGPFVQIAAPGVNIYSTYKGGGYATMSGTSMAAPHVTGAVARYLAANSSAMPLDAYQAMINLGLANSSQTSDCGFTGDSDGIPEPLVNVTGL